MLINLKLNNYIYKLKNNNSNHLLYLSINSKIFLFNNSFKVFGSIFVSKSISLILISLSKYLLIKIFLTNPPTKNICPSSLKLFFVELREFLLLKSELFMFPLSRV